MDRHSNRNRRGWCLFPGYNWCGPGCNGPGAPVNEVDACCKMHDECYAYYGASCYCDQMFSRCLEPYINPYTEEGRRARTMHRYMKAQQLFTCAFSRNNR
ncbi:phospholipase [Thalassobacillus hwangdonensis]|uniref:Phospholipase n=1 Tax=Thalassobacillus hwangdonensis TaxID=546108 RepID=A0ABW3KZ89_9BACI